jgi:mannosyltransferase OCH1-like enzyme
MINKKNYIDLHMQYSYAKNYDNMIHNEDWKKIISCYNNFELNKDVIIPKKIHQIWLGKKIPTELLQLTDTVRQHNPDYNYKLWTDDDINILFDKYFNKL